MEDALDEPIDAGDLDALQGILLAREDGAEGLLVDAIQGLLVAIVIGPEPVPVETWMPLIVDDGRAFESEAAAGQALRLILRLHRTVEASIEDDEFHPILTELESEGDEEGRLSARGWCEGFSIGVDLAAEAWEARMAADPQLLQVLGPIIALAADEDLFEPPDDGPLPPLSDSEYDAALRALPEAVVAVHRYWTEHPPGATPPPGSAPLRVPRRRGGRSVH